jgi:AraC-like DNA-binding protein
MLFSSTSAGSLQHPSSPTLETSRARARIAVPRAPMIPAHDRDEFVAAPIGRCIVEPSFATWCHAPDLQGVIVWGVPDDRSIRDMMEIGQFIHHPDIAKRRRVLVDCRDIERADADVLLGFIAIARARVEAWAGSVERQAMIVPGGLGGLLLAGALPSAGIAHPLRIAQDLETALAFVDHPEAAAAHAAATAVAAATRGPSALLFRLRAHIRRDPLAATIEGSATALGMSTRTLQRVLRGLETSYSKELRRVRVAAAEALLVHTDLKIDAIASQLGFGKASRMSASLRRELDVTASELRGATRLPGSSHRLRRSPP